MRARALALLVDIGGTLDPDLLALVDEVRAAGLTVVVDTVANTPEPLAAKPAREFFGAVCAAVAVPPEKCLFVDTDDRNVLAARVAGLAAFRWTGPADVPYLRAALAL